MPERSLLLSPAPYHVLSYGALLGTQFFHTFVNSVTSFKVLERPQFGILQRAVFPTYFGIQTAVPVVLALTYPGRAGRFAALPQGVMGVLHPANRWGVLVPLTAAFATGLVNLVFFLPQTNNVTAQRKKQETKDKKPTKKEKRRSAPGGFPDEEDLASQGESKDMKALNRKFGQLHGFSSLFNMVTLISTVAYGINLAARIE